ncbi:MAG: tRNA pseudouridine(55) synthase TruB [Deltaproteobacteria bacterium]|nr:tRNA pseudouridine(55) synthase TruB [Deltaproteobacteria bacterium]
MGPATDGILLIDKCRGETSHGVVKKIRFAFQDAGRVKVGHAGTLDPFATGLLIVLLGQGTKLSQFIMPGEKVYSAILELGVETDTLDLTGRVVATAAVPDMSLEYVRERAKRFVGKLHQVPPAYSAIRVKGKRAYELARKGRPVDLMAREITVHSLQVLSIDLPYIRLHIRCSSGTYIRSIGSELGKALGPGGRLSSLRRIKSGPFDVETALSSAEMDRGTAGPSLAERIIPMREAIPHMGEINVSSSTAEKVRQGCQPVWEKLMAGCDSTNGIESDFCNGWIKLVSDGRLAAILHVAPGNGGGRGRVNIERVFSL